MLLKLPVVMRKQGTVTEFQGNDLHFTMKVKFTQSLWIQNPLFSETKSLIQRKNKTQSTILSPFEIHNPVGWKLKIHNPSPILSKILDQ